MTTENKELWAILTSDAVKERLRIASESTYDDEGWYDDEGCVL